MNPDDSNTGTMESQLAGSPFVSPQRIETETAPSSASESSALKHQEFRPEADLSHQAKTDHLGAEKKHDESNLIHFEDHKSFNFGLALAWIIALLSITATLYFWWLNRNLTDALEDKKEKRTAVVSQLESPGNKEVETEANNFKASVAALTAAKTARSPVGTFLPDFYTKIDNDVKITSMSMSAGGALSIAGTTANYRTIADQVMALKSWSQLSDVDLTSSSYSVDAENIKSAASFSITAKVKSSSTTTTGASATSVSGTTTGGAQ
jgi:hypothetical protein